MPIIIGFIVAVGLAVIAYGLTSALTSRDQTGLRSYARGEIVQLEVLADAPPRPETQVIDEAGAISTLAAFDGRVTLVNLWATWCAPCLREMPSLDRLAGQLPAERFAIAPVSLDARIEDAVAWFDEHGIENLSVLHDNTFEIARSLQAGGLPVSVIYDARGIEVARLSGGAEWDSPEAVSLIEAVIAQSFPDDAETLEP